MNDLERILANIHAGFHNQQIMAHDIIAVLLMVGVMSLYEFLVYRYISKRSFYSKQFNIALALLPFFIATIIMALQSNLVITLGTIGALAIIRFRTAIKDPIDMVYLLWSTHIGIICGTGLYEAGIITSLFATLFIVVLDLVPIKKSSYLFIVNADSATAEKEIMTTVKANAKIFKVKSRNLTKNKLDMIIELRTDREQELLTAVSAVSGVLNSSLVSHDGENFI
jgi:MgtC family.